MKITFFGAAQGVTGSKHLIESGDYKVLLDCGLHQGRRHEAYELNRVLPFSATDIQATILSHAHADHCGLLPMLVKDGYQGKIFATPATVDIARLIMLDSAKIQESDFQNLLEYGPADEKPLPPLYTTDDVENACRHFESVPYQRVSQTWKELSEGCRFKFYDAGHILGSAVTVLEYQEQGQSKTLAYTGDLGNTRVPILPEPENISEEVETLISECTYGDQNHRSLDEAATMLTDIIKDAVANKRKIIAPAFALGRTQELIYVLHKLYDEGKIPVIPIYLDSPLASEVTAAFAKHQEDWDQETEIDFGRRHEPPFAFQNLHTVETVEASKALVSAPGPYMVVASSGMAEGGRILHYLEHSVADPNAIIMLTGFQAEQTLGRKLQEGVTPVRIYNKMHDVKARVMYLSEFSAHADQRGLLDYVTATKGLKNVFLVHAELSKAESFKKILTERFPQLQVVIPAPGQSFEI